MNIKIIKKEYVLEPRLHVDGNIESERYQLFYEFIYQNQTQKNLIEIIDTILLNIHLKAHKKLLIQDKKVTFHKFDKNIITIFNGQIKIFELEKEWVTVSKNNINDVKSMLHWITDLLFESLKKYEEIPIIKIKISDIRGHKSNITIGEYMEEEK